MTKRSMGGLAWVGLAVYVATYDYWAISRQNETMSAAYGRSMAHPIARWGTVLVTTGLIKHLVLPHWLPQVDPFAALAEKWRRDAELKGL